MRTNQNTAPYLILGRECPTYGQTHPLDTFCLSPPSETAIIPSLVVPAGGDIRLHAKFPDEIHNRSRIFCIFLARKINTDTDLRLALTSQTRKILTLNKKEFDLRNYLGKGREEIENVVKTKIENILFSFNKI